MLTCCPIRQTLFIESYVDDQEILKENARNVKISSPDVSTFWWEFGEPSDTDTFKFIGMDPDEAAKRYLKRIEKKIPVFETMEEDELNYVKMINAGRAFFYNNVSFNYLSHRIVFYLTNLHIKFRTTFFVRAGPATDEDSFKADAPLSEEGESYAIKMTDALLKHREEERQAAIARGDSGVPLRPLTVWTSTRLRTIQTAEPLKELGYKVRQRSEMSQINPGVCEKLSERAIRALYPEEVEKHVLDPYHHRYPRAEVCRHFTLFNDRYFPRRRTHADHAQSYHDLAVRLEPIILELEREQNDLLIIAHESVLRVLYSYLMHCSTMDIPKLKFPRDKIIEIIPAAYQNKAKRIDIIGLDPRTIPGSPEDIRIPVANEPSANLTPIPGMSSPGPVEFVVPKSTEKVVENTVTDKVADED